ncbi:MAG: hypothetical protein A3G44_18555 [Candidatus Rokubacteria bacterium RIFCSPLOWO2_12_FULL_73_47]|nr:MAG: hypothetical protein A3G44_18555 [Candidatus Rokubacteria bacterium RIFCSPLOWO2_12_FULL_73_47]
MAETPATNQLFELWKRQLEEGTQAWTRLLGQQAPQAPAIDPAAFWRPVLNQGLETWARLFAQTPASPEMLTQWKQFLDQWIDAWSRALGQTMGTEQFARLINQQLDAMLTAQAPLKKAFDQQVEQALQTFNLPSRAQLTGVARQIVELEDRIERMEDTLGAVLRRLEAREPR